MDTNGVAGDTFRRSAQEEKGMKMTEVIYPSNPRELRIAVLSGKGGTGKTFLSVNLAVSAPSFFQSASPVANGSDRLCWSNLLPSNPFRYVDCDVEEPNGHLFLKPESVCAEAVSVMVPAWDEARCNGCRICTSFCRFNALAYVRDRVKIFPELCHGCNGCVLLCPTGAMTESSRSIGQVECGQSGGIDVLTGVLSPGEATGVAVIHSLVTLLDTHPAVVTVLDCPPGSGCAVMECIRESDACILVVEPTLFGLHDMGMVSELVRKLGKPAGLLFNRCTESTEELAQVAARKEGLPVIGLLPFDGALAGLLAEGGVAVREMAHWHALFCDIWGHIRKEVIS